MNSSVDQHLKTLPGKLFYFIGSKSVHHETLQLFNLTTTITVEGFTSEHSQRHVDQKEALILRYHDANGINELIIGLMNTKVDMQEYIFDMKLPLFLRGRLKHAELVIRNHRKDIRYQLKYLNLQQIN